MHNLSEILNDITNSVPVDVVVTPPPFTELQNPVACLTLTYPLLFRAIRYRQRIETLIYAYYVGLIFTHSTPAQRRALQNLITKHYYLTSIKVYDVFSMCGEPAQIYQTNTLKFGDLRQLKTEEMGQLIEDLHSLVELGF
ncbi:6241_t:CDS:1 [Cetraspora pellucida]|uniref:6241_t:CDS:1 n=1 Tax=Cetraspora pellucida TaxID=1433469 RepID=A0A9N9B527_9GLOM|nr:6241_t:CDS:1 [Cetraspora pellucida]